MSKFLVCKELMLVMENIEYTHSKPLIEHVRKAGFGVDDISDEEIVDVFEHYWNNKREEEWMDYEMGECVDTDY